MFDIVLSPISVPLLNTFLLLASGVFVTYSHHSFLVYFRIQETISNLLSIRQFINYIAFDQLAVLLMDLSYNSTRFFFSRFISTLRYRVVCYFFILLQVTEYLESLFNMSDNVYGSTFFVMTGFHGVHVLVGTIFLIICLFRLKGDSLAYKSSTGFECAIWYWHFVDVVWLFLFISVYWWGNTSDGEFVMYIRADIRQDCIALSKEEIKNIPVFF